jgi:hypothetical protein
MKKIIVGIAIATLFFGCNSADDSAKNSEETPVVAAPIVDETPMTDDLFVAISAEILCLPMNYEDANSAVIESLAEAILAEASVGKKAFSTYQKTIEADADSKQEISLAIVGRMEDFCELNVVAEEEPTPTESTEN